MSVHDGPQVDIQALMAQLQAQQHSAAAMAAEVAMRRNVVRWASVLCACRYPVWPVRGETGPPQAGCMVHGGALVSPDGLEVI